MKRSIIIVILLLNIILSYATTNNQSVEWKKLSNVNLTGTTVFKNADAGNGWNASMSSLNLMKVGENGHIEFQIETLQYYSVSLTSTDYSAPTEDRGEFEFILRPASVGGATIYIQNVYTKWISCAIGDVFKIEKVGNTVYFKKNNQTVHTTSSASNDKDYRAKTCVYSSSVEITLDVTASFTPKHRIRKWKDLTNVTIAGDNTTKTTPNGWDAGKFSVGKIRSGEDGFIEHVIKTNTSKKWYMIGISSSNPNAHHSTIEYKWYIRGNNIQIRKLGSVKATHPTYAVDDVLRIEKIGSTVVFKINGTVIKTFSGAEGLDPTKDYHIDCSFSSSGNHTIPLYASFADPSDSYVVLKKRLDGSKAIVDSDLKFKFRQEYAVPSGSSINYKVYDSQHNLVLDDYLSLSYGMNWFTVSTNSLNSGEQYTLEMEGNKKQKYYLKFKYQKNDIEWDSGAAAQ